MTLNNKWINHIEDERNRELFKKHLLENVALFKRLKEILEGKLKDSEVSRRSLKSYVTNSYGEYQADRNATERTILEIIDLLPTPSEVDG